MSLNKASGLTWTSAQVLSIVAIAIAVSALCVAIFRQPIVVVGQEGGTSNPFVAPQAVANAGAGCGAPSAAGCGGPAGGAPAAIPTPLPDAQAWEIIQEAEGVVLGKKNAPVTLYMLMDYQCPFCARFAVENFPDLKERYVDTGKVRYVLVDFPLSIHPNATPAAIAARCAGEQDKYWQMHDRIIAGQTEWSRSGSPMAIFKRYATDLGLRVDRFDKCVAGGDAEKLVRQNLAVVERARATGTPTFFVNGKRIFGVNAAGVAAEIDAALASR